MNVRSTEIPGVLLVEPVVHADHRGYFLEAWSRDRYAAHGIPPTFSQDNLSRSRRGVLRGLHLQHPRGQGKLVSVVEGEVFDVAADVRVGSPTFGRWTATVLSSDTHRQIWIPPGLAHGFCVTSETAVLAYKCTEPYHRASELGILWSDPDLAIRWPTRNPDLSAKDAAFPCLAELSRHRLPAWRPRPSLDVPGAGR